MGDGGIVRADTVRVGAMNSSKAETMLMNEAVNNCVLLLVSASVEVPKSGVKMEGVSANGRFER
jgi:hypothetical protein